MSAAQAVAAVDLGASSGRVILGYFGDDGLLQTRHIARFGNSPVRLPDGLHWNILELYQQVLAALAQVERSAPGQIASVGIDTWGVDYALMRNNSMVGVPFHYRDGRNADAMAKVHQCVPPDELYRRNGVQHLPINTVYQLVAEGERLAEADRLLLTPDLLNFWLTGREAAERTMASTTGLLDARTRTWDLGLVGTLGIPARALPDLVDAGTPLGPLLPDVASYVGRALDVTAIGSHDTASAVVAAPNSGQDFAYISCGTWGLAGLELTAPVLSDDAREAGFTNEAGVDGTTRFHRNVTGLWLLSESLRQWEPGATDAQRSSLLQQLLHEAAKAGQQPVFDVNDPAFLPAGDIPRRITEWFGRRGERAPGSRPEIVRSIVESIADAFARTIDAAARLADREVRVIHVVGGGSQNALLCQATANRSGLTVVAGPVEATAIGNILVQARASGLIFGDLPQLRLIAARGLELISYEPTR
jgi:rhamnulokinase